MDHGTRAFTTRQVLDGAAIARVYHDEDGDWQLFEEDGPLSEADGRIVHLGHLIERDPTILELRGMAEGFEASRADGGNGWVIVESPPWE